MPRTFTHIAFGRCSTLFVLCFLASTAIRAQVGLIYFIDDAPGDISRVCFTDIEAGNTLRAGRILEAGTIDTFLVAPVDSIADDVTACTGGPLFRIWKETGTINSIRDVQEITFGASPSTDSPSFSPNGLPASRVEVDCQIATNPAASQGYLQWLNVRRIATAAAITLGCSPIESLTDNAPDELVDFSCQDSVVVTFTLTDICDRTAAIAFTYVTVDTIAPVILDVGPSNISLSCSDSVPNVPNVRLEDCDDNATFTYSETSTRVLDGSCQQYNYTIERNWVATDRCNNMSSATQVITVADNEPPDFDVPTTRTRTCSYEPDDENLGLPTNLTDNCTPVDELVVTFTDEIITIGACPNRFNVRRTWRVTDICNNSRIKTQTIRVRDNDSPLFDPPPAQIQATCSNFEDLDVTGRPTNLRDFCDPTVNLSFEDEIIAGSCAGNFTVNRRWRIFDDCGNDRFFTQEITVIDTIGPSFINMPADLTTSCNNSRDQEALFRDWLVDISRREFTDNCTAGEDVTLDIFATGSDTFPVLPPLICRLGDNGLVREQFVDLVLTDECGNVTRQTIVYRQFDEQPVNIFDCPRSAVIPTDPGVCMADILLLPPTIEDQCDANPLLFINRRDTTTLTSQASTPTELGSVPVDGFTLNLPIDLGTLVNGQAFGVLTINMENVDAEGSDEFFFVYAEDGALLGTTENSNLQCGNSTTTIDINGLDFTRWVRDDTVSFRFEPNIPDGRPGTFAINNLCTSESTVDIHLRMPVKRIEGLVYEIDINGTGFERQEVGIAAPRTLSPGLHQVTYRVTDCGNDVDECTFTLTVEDQEAPQITCPESIVSYLEADKCQQDIDLPLPPFVADNCTPYTVSSVAFPSGNDVTLFNFTLDPNLNTYQAQPVPVVLNDIPAALADSVIFDVRLRGDFTSATAILDVILADGTVIGSSSPGVASCSRPGSMTFKVSAADFMATATDNTTTILLRPRPVSVPPGQQGDGVAPCFPDQVSADGATDGFSGVGLTVTYQSLFPSFSVTGAIEIALTGTDTSRLGANFNVGVSEVTYRIADPSGNTASCTFNVTVFDTIRPEVVCQPTTVFVDPSGIEPTTINPAVLTASATDNCMIDTSYLSVPAFGCERYGETPEVTLFVADESGNLDSCTTIVSVAPLEPSPTATNTVCNGDTLRLFANPPTVAAPGQTIYTYRWTNPTGEMFSTQQNPVLPNASRALNGTYSLTIRGITGCEATGVVVVNIQETTTAPVLDAPQRVCFGEDVPLRALTEYIGSVRYEWYRGQPGAGVFLGSSTVATFTAPFADGAQSGDFYVIGFVNGCESPVSNVVTVGFAQQPNIDVANDTVAACELGEIRLTALGSDNLVYQWTGPDDFEATGKSIIVPNLTMESAGTYTIRGVRSEGCFSEPVTLELTITPASAPTTLTAETTICPSDTLQLEAAFDGTATYIFEGPNGFAFTSSDRILRIAPSETSRTGAWTVRLQTGDCPSAPSTPVMVTESDNPEALTTVIPDPVCEGNDVILQGGSNISGSSYRWEGPNGFVTNGIAADLESVTMADAGNYVLTVTTPTGCNNTDTLALEVLPGILINNIDVISGQCLRGGEPAQLVADITPALPEGYTYRWNGPEGTSSNDTFRIPALSLASNGRYSLEVINATGCVSPLFEQQIEFDFAPAAPLTPFTDSGIASACEGDSLVLRTTDYGFNTTYLWSLGDGTNIPTDTNFLRIPSVSPGISGVFTVRAEVDGCISLPSAGRTFQFTAIPSLTVQANDPACTGQAINFQTTDIAGAVYAWRGPNNFSASIPNPVIASADPNVHIGRYSVVASLNGCVADSVFVDIEVRPTPSVPVIQPVAPICLADPAAVLNLSINPNTATEGATYQWFIQNGQVPVGDPSTTGSLSVTDLSLFAGGGVFDFQVRSLSNGCSSALSAPVSVQIDAPGNERPDAGQDTTICSGMHVLRAGMDGIGTGQWTLVSGAGDINIGSPTSRTTVVEGLVEFGSPYLFAWTLTNGSCIDYAADTVTVFITDGEEAVAGENIITCFREETRLDANAPVFPGSAGVWTQALSQELLGIVIESPNDPNTIISGLQADNVYSFTWTITSNCGVKDDIVLVSVSDPTPFAGDDEGVCNDDRSAILMADEPTIGSTGRWRSLDAVMTITDPESAVTPVIGLQVGLNRFVWEVDEGLCGDRSRDTVTILYAASPAPQDDEYAVPFQGSVTFDPAENDDLPAGATVAFDATPMGTELTDNGDGTFTFTAPASFVGELEVVYRIIDDNCDEVSASVFFLIGNDAQCEAPNIFTPNEDGMNDRFVVPCLLDTDRFPDSQVIIYNQWGDEVFRSERPYRNDWDGTFQGRQLPAATYFYTIDFGSTREGDSGAVRIER